MEQFYLTGHQDVSIMGRHWALESPDAVVLIVHGFGEHSGRYSQLAEYFMSRNIAVVSFDNRGHGLSEGRRGHIMSWREYREDLKSVYSWVENAYPTTPFYLMGHSLGGLITLDFLLSSESVPRGAIVASPGLGVTGVSPILLRITKLLSGFLPSFSANANLDLRALSRDQKIGQAFEDDPLTHGRGTARLSTEMEAAQKRILRRAESLVSPILLVYGDADKIVSPEAIDDFFDAAGGDDKVLQVFPGAFHELHNETMKEDVFLLYAEWILART